MFYNPLRLHSYLDYKHKERRKERKMSCHSPCHSWFEEPKRRTVIRVGLLKTIPGFHPAGALRATKFVPDKFVKPTVAMRQRLRSPLLCQINSPAEAGLFIWRRGWDSNPRRAINPCWFSRPVHSTALPPLLICARESFCIACKQTVADSTPRRARIPENGLMLQP